ncbi:hypothetical protein PC129_g21433 [Phytophthora cactorum]|uniref:Uncharacterized protein n=1 Tax=Phytophthora cactorum TaxID=29920 RepID=A0A329RLQ7_9STRA|nr:hypothetical protein PC111_g15779 [Phytophthora cactorum]KAG2824047.1 hypothetical protein PC113_g22091 [Phytophthora cactorum]KAG2875421.1 hypothetical protein PC114_g24733 [Phytophthora cactorum]KAG2882208.1 hypothetical protein PC115_g22005 [Phytophthora cactorum]KAG2890006.1 hypothetical protein PC117_g24569 [Phytophthora cactorum]
MSKQAILAQITAGEEAATTQKMEIIAFKEAISRIELDLQARVLTVTS